jgi:methionyl-tRNA formyltransferase
MKGKGILILMGYDYVHAIEDLVKAEDTFILITKNNTQFIQPDNLAKLEAIMGDRLLISTQSAKDIEGLVASGKYATLLTLGWRKLLDVNKFDALDRLVNVHPALLPEYKGYHPVPFVLLNQEANHGITAHEITNEMDAGAIILRREIAINPFSTLPSLQYLVNQEMPSFIMELFALIRSEDIELKPNNDEDTVVRAPKRTPEDSEVRLEDTVAEMFLKVKASDANRFPAYFIINGEKVNIRLYRDEDAKRQTEFDI